MDDQKEIYRLWYEYLKRSENYKDYHEWFYNSKVNADETREPELPEKFKQPLNEGPLQYDQVLLWDHFREVLQNFVESQAKGSLAEEKQKMIDKLSSKTFHIPDIFRNPTIQDELHWVLVSFMDVHRVNFEEWWEKEKDSIDFDARWGKKAIKFPAISDYPIEVVIDDLITRFKIDNDREPSASELNAMIVEFNEARQGQTLISLNLAYKPAELKKEFNELLNSKYMKERMAQAKELQWLKYHKNKRPTGKPRLDELQKYLDVYDMWKEKVQNRKQGDPSGWNKIVLCFEPASKAKDPIECAKSFKRKHGKEPGVLDLQEMLDEEKRRQVSLSRIYKRYKQKAENIISNVKEGYFPGDY